MKQKKQILVIDDDIRIGDMLEEMLTQEGYGVSRAYSGTEALLVLSVKKPDLVLLDLMLPGLGGDSGYCREREGRSRGESLPASWRCGGLCDKTV